MALLGLSLSVPKAHAQWTVYDPGNFAGNIANSVKEIATAGKTVKNTLDGFKEGEKLYNDTKKYYDALKKVNNLDRKTSELQSRQYLVCRLLLEKKKTARTSFRGVRHRPRHRI